MNPIESIRPRVDKLQQRALIVGGVGLILCVVGAFVSTEQFFRSYLFGFLFWIGLPLGSLAILLLHHLVGGPWGFSIRRILESGIRTIPLMAILFIPILFGIHSLYEWSHTEVVKNDAILLHKAGYLNTTFFIVRSAIYFGIWIGVSFLVNRWMRRLEKSGGPVVTAGLQNFSAIALVLYFLTMTFASFDWAMSLEPHWFSTIYGVIFIVGQALATFAFSIAVLVVLVERNPQLKELILPGYFHDLGNFLFAFMLLWAYVSISQFLIIWSANLPEETPWYYYRAHGGWGAVPIILAFFHFVVPLFLLLMRKVKRTPKLLARVALLIIAMRIVEIFWLVAPAFHREGFHIHWLDIVAPIAIGGIWLGFFLRQFKGESVLPLNAPIIKKQEGDHD